MTLFDAVLISLILQKNALFYMGNFTIFTTIHHVRNFSNKDTKNDGPKSAQIVPSPLSKCKGITNYKNTICNIDPTCFRTHGVRGLLKEFQRATNYTI